MFASCSDEEEGGFSGETKISATELAFAESGGTQTLSIASETEPQVVSNQEWCSVAFANATQRGTYTYDITAEANTETEARTATLSVTAGSFSASVNVTQTAGDGLIVAQTSYEMPSTGGLLSIALTTNGDYSYTINDSWITEAEVSDARAMSEYTLHFTVSANHGAIYCSGGRTRRSGRVGRDPV